MGFNLAGKLLLIWYLFVFLSTETLSFFNLLKREYILFGYLLLILILFFLYRKTFLKLFKKVELKSRVNFIILLLLTLTFIQGIFSAPNTTDSMVYHLPRVMYWIQEGTLQQEVIRNLHDFMPPFGEYILLHLYFIAGNDRFLFFSQWIAYVVIVILSGVIAGQLGAESKIRNLTRLIVATLPIAIMQSSSTQVDLVITVLILINTHIALLFLNKITIANAILFGLTLGLGISTKPTFFIFALIPLGVTFFALIKNRFKDVLKIFLCGLISLVLPLRFMSQNLYFYGNILGPLKNDGDAGLTNDLINPQSLISNIIRNMMIHIPIPFFTTQAQSILEFIHKIIGISINSSQTTCCDFQFRVIPILYPQEDIVSNTLHLGLILIATIFIFNKKMLKHKLLILVYTLSLLSFIAFSIVLKWQPFHSRLHTPFFVIGTISSILIISKHRIGQTFLELLLILTVVISVFLILFNFSRPFISYSIFYEKIKSFATPLSNIPSSFFIKPRIEQYFNSRYYWYKPYTKVIDHFAKLENTKKVSFLLLEGFEYPLWVLIKEHKINTQVVPYPKIDGETIIISTSKEPFFKEGYTTSCYKTSIEYGFACISKK